MKSKSEIEQELSFHRVRQLIPIGKFKWLEKYRNGHLILKYFLVCKKNVEIGQ